ncbi:MAG TPA: ABC transporter permease [Desulfobacteraceae bacterium]|nr:ABC transporter permease [Desulfobacteraceae bacterium]
MVMAHHRPSSQVCILLYKGINVRTDAFEKFHFQAFRIMKIYRVFEILRSWQNSNMSDLANFRHYRQLIFVKVAANLKAEASRYSLSYLWWIFEPILHMTVYYLVFGLLLQRGTEDFVAFLLTGVIPWLWFNKTVSNSMMSIVSGKALMMQVHIPKIVLPTIVIFQDAVKQTVVMVLLLIFLIIYSGMFSLCWISLPVLMGTEIFIIAAFAYFVAAVIPFMLDLRFLVSAGLMMLMFCSGVFYSDKLIPVQYHQLFYLNPMANLLRNYRTVLLHGQWPDWQALLCMAGGSLAGILIMELLMRRLDHIYPRVVQ